MDQTEKPKTKKKRKAPMKPGHAAAIGPSVAVALTAISLLLAPYVELHTAHVVLLVGVILAVGFVPTALIVALSKSPHEWGRRRW